MSPRFASPSEATVVAGLLHDFNAEYDTPSPGVAVLASRLRELLAERGTAAILCGRPAVAVALVTYRRNVWFDGEVALLDELYVRPERRGEGVGSAIVAFLLAESSARGVELVEINVDEEDVDAQRFYLRQGFRSGTGPAARELYFSLELP